MASLTFQPAKGYVIAYDGGRSSKLELHQVEPLLAIFYGYGLVSSALELEDAYLKSGGVPYGLKPETRAA